MSEHAAKGPDPMEPDPKGAGPKGAGTPSGSSATPKLAATKADQETVASAKADRSETPVAPPQAGDGKGKRRKKPKGRWWWRWSKRLVVAGLVTRIVLWLFLEQIADFGASYAGLSVSWRSASLSLSGLSLYIEDLVVRDRDDADAPPLVTAQEVIADLSMRQLLSGQLSVVDAGIAGARITVHRNADGSLRLPKAWTEPAAVTLPEEEEEPAETDEPLRFELPCWIASTRLHDLQFDFVDHSVSPTVHHTGKLDLDVADIGFPDRNGSVMLRVHAPQLCDELFVHTKIEAAPENADVHFAAAVRGFRPHRFGLPQEYLDMIGNAHVVDVRLGGDLNAKVLASAPKHPAIAGGLDFGLSLDGVERSALKGTFGPTEVTGAGTVDVGVVTPFSLTMHTDGVIDALRLEEGRLELAGTRSAVTAKLRGERLTCLRLRPLLAEAGISLPPDGIDLDANLDAEFGESMSIDLGRIAIRDGEKEMLSLPKLAVRDLRTVDETLAIGSVEIVGPSLPVRREADGTMQIAGVRIRPPAAAASTEPTATTQPEPAGNPAGNPTGAAAAPLALPKIRLGSFDWSGCNVSYTDAGQAEPTTIAIDNLHLHADGLTLGEDSDVPGRITAAFSLPEIAERTTAQITLHPRVDGLRTDLSWTTDGITLQRLEPWLTPAGIVSEFGAGKLQLAANADVTLGESGIEASARVVNLQLLDGKDKLLTVRSVDGSGIRISDRETHIGTWNVRDPFIAVARDADQVLHAVGLAIGAAAPSASDTQPSATPARPTTPAPNPAAQANAAPLTHGKLTVDRTTLTFRDARYPDRTFSLGLDAEIGESAPGAELPIDVTVRLDRAMKSCGIQATLRRDPTSERLVGKLSASGIAGKELEMLLPAGMECTLVDGSLNADFEAQLEHTANAPMLAKVRNIALRDRDTELFAIDEIVADLPMVTDDEVHVRDAHVTGIRAIVTKTETALHVPGFAFANAPADKPAQPQPPEAVAPTQPEAVAPTQPAAEDAEPQPPLILPKLRIDALALELERFELRDRTDETREPLVVTTGLKLAEPWLGDPAADEPVAMQLAITGLCQPLGASFRADTRLSPFDLTPTLDIDFLLENFDTTQLQRVLPSLGDQLRGEAKSLTAKAQIHAFVNLKRRDPRKFDLQRSLGAELTIENVELRDGDSDQPYASIASIDAIVRAIQPSTGSVLLRSVTIDEPKLRVEQDEHGMHVAGFLLPPPPAAAPEATPAGGDEPATAPNPKASNPEASNPEASDPVAAQPEPGASSRAATESGAEQPEFAIDRFDLLGLEVDFKDATTEPPTHLLLRDTDAQLKRFSTRAFDEARPMSFSLNVRGGPIELEKRVIKSSVIAGLLTSGAEALVGANSEHEYEQRAMLDELRVDGQLQLFPATIGRVNISMSELELAAFRGLAKQAGVELTDGLYDMRVGIDLKGYDGIDIRSNHVFTYLELDEPPDGPLSRYLRLPAPIQAVLFVLRNADDEQRLPISLHVPADGVSQSAIIGLAVENLIKLIGDAFGGVGGRVLGGATGGLLGGSSDVPDVTVEIPFAPGSPLPASHDLQPLIEAALADETLSIVLTHEMGAADQPFAARLANPDREVVQATIARLQRKRAQLEAERTPLAADVVALYAAGKVQEALQTHERLRALDRHQGELLIALGQAIEQIGNPRKRNALRRTRRAATALAESRLDAIATELGQSCPQLVEKASEDAPPRIERRPGRGLPIAGIDGGGRILAILRRRAAQDLPKNRPQREPGQTTSIRSSGFTTVPPLVDPGNRAFNNR